MKSALEEILALQFRVYELTPEREHRFAPGRRWRFDFAWPKERVAVEVEGGVWTRGRHTRGSGFVGDLEKYNAAALLGWIVIRVTGNMVRSGEAVRLAREALAKGAA